MSGCFLQLVVETGNHHGDSAKAENATSAHDYLQHEHLPGGHDFQLQRIFLQVADFDPFSAFLVVALRRFDSLVNPLGVSKAEHRVISAMSAALAFLHIYHGGFCPDSVVQDMLASGMDAVHDVDGGHAHKYEKQPRHAAFQGTEEQGWDGVLHGAAAYDNELESGKSSIMQKA